MAIYLADLKGIVRNEEARLGATRGIAAETVEAAALELTAIASHARSAKPLFHVHVDPESRLSQAEELIYWSLFESEFDLKTQPYFEAIHVKRGRQHYHRVYSLVRPNGTVINL